jgi:hypothetical protein
MRKPIISKLLWPWGICAWLLVAGTGLSLTSLAGPPSQGGTLVAQGGGTTIVQGGTGQAGGFIPVLTTIAFHAQRTGHTVTGGFECMARAPEAATGTGSAQFTVNAMYVTGELSGASVNGDQATLTGTATITGLGAGHNVPFTFVFRKGGPGATAVLTSEGTPRLVFNEVLVEGSFQIPSGNSEE